MKDQNKTKKQLIGELTELRQRIAELEAAETERKQAEEALQESEEKFRNLAEHSPNMIFINNRGRVVYANRRCEEVMGYTRDQFYSADFDFLTLIAPDHRESVRASFGKHLQGEDIEPYEYALVTKDGRRIEAILTTRLINYEGERAILGTVTDITERRQAEEALQESEGKYRTLFETMAQGVVYQSADGRIASANPAAERILGLALEQMQGRTSRDPRWKAIREDGSEFPGDAHPAMVALKTGKEVRNVVMGVFNPRKEDYAWININAVPQFRSGEEKPYQVYTTFEDITQRKRAEEQVRASLQEKEAMLVEIHHRVKNNLQIITSLLDFQAAFAQNEQVGGLLRESIDRVRSMVLIHDQLYQAPDLAQIDFADYVQTLAANLFAAYRVDPDPAITLQLDVQDVFLEIKEAIPCGLLINELVSNALKYAFPATKGWPRGFTGEIGVSFRATGEGEYTLVVSDNGIGLPADFEFPSEDTLGLLLTNALVRQLGGSVEWDGDGGTTCRIVFEA